MAAHLTRSDGGFRKCCIFSVVDGTDNMLGNGSEGNGDVRGECEGDEAWNVKMETVTLIGKGRSNLTRCTY